MKDELLPSSPNSDRIGELAIPCLTELDARSAAPPNHLNAILAAMAALPPGQSQFLRTKEQPNQLLSALVAHGISAATNELPDGSWRTALRRTAAFPPF